MDDNSGTGGIFLHLTGWSFVPWNIITETIATFVLIFWILTNRRGRHVDLGYAAVSFVVITIGLGLGWSDRLRSTAPRIQVLVSRTRCCRFAVKANADWGCLQWVPVVGLCSAPRSPPEWPRCCRPDRPANRFVGPISGELCSQCGTQHRHEIRPLHR